MRRVLNSFLQFIEQDKSGSLIIAATNNPKLLDRALFRRFDDVLFYEMPSTEERRQLMENVMAVFLPAKFIWKNILKDSNGLSQAEIVLACRDAIKQSILEDKETVSADLIRSALKERQNSKLGFRG
jgi:AAA+ superfamily predicted ATPase